MSINYENKMIFFLKDFFLSPPSGFVVVFFSLRQIYLFIYLSVLGCGRTAPYNAQSCSLKPCKYPFIYLFKFVSIDPTALLTA